MAVLWLKDLLCDAVQVDVFMKTDCSLSSLLSVRSDHCVMPMNHGDVTDIPSQFQHALLQLALPMSCRDGVIQQLCADPSAVNLVCLLSVDISLLSLQ